MRVNTVLCPFWCPFKYSKKDKNLELISDLTKSLSEQHGCRRESRGQEIWKRTTCSQSSFSYRAKPVFVSNLRLLYLLPLLTHPKGPSPLPKTNVSSPQLHLSHSGTFTHSLLALKGDCTGRVCQETMALFSLLLTEFIMGWNMWCEAEQTSAA